MYDIIIIGGGPTGLNAGLYAGRAGLKALIIEKLFSGGQAATTYEVDNYLGFVSSISGPDLVMKMEEHAKKFGAEIIHETVESVELSGPVKTVKTPQNSYQARVVILAMGAQPKKLGVTGEAEFSGRGVSYCATCDGNFYRHQPVMVVGGGDTALEDALYLSNICKTVYLVHRRDSFRGAKTLSDAVRANPNIQLVLNAQVERLEGEKMLHAAYVRKNGADAAEKFEISGIFIAVGADPSSDLVRGMVDMDENGYIITDEDMRTSLPGVLAAGDIRQKKLRQIITAASDGAVAIYTAQGYLAGGDA